MSESFLNITRNLESFILKKSKNSHSTKRNYQCAFRHFENKFLSEQYQARSISDILEELKIHSKPQEAIEDLMQGFIDWSESQNIPQTSIQNRISIILGYLKYQRISFDKDEFYQNIEVKKSIREKLKPITLEQFRSILDHCSTFDKRVFYILISSSGLRVREALGLRIKDIDTTYKRYLIHVSREFAKAHKSRDTFCSKEVMPLLDKLMKGKQKEDFIFPHNEERMDYAVVNEDVIFSRCKKRAGIESAEHEITIHGLRAFFISAFEKNSSSFGHEFAGHSKYMDTYHRYTNEEKIKEYIKSEHNLSIYGIHETEELDEIKQKLLMLDKLTKNPKFQKFLEELD